MTFTQASARTWAIGAALLALLLAAGSWFLLISPSLEVAAGTREQVATQENTNDLLELKLVTLRKQSEELPQYRAELEGLHLQMPTEAALADYLNQVSRLAEGAGLTVTDLAPTTPEDVVLAAPAAPAAAATTTDTTATAEAESATVADATTSAGADAVAVTGLRTAAFSMTASGTYAQGRDFVRALQQGDQRLYLVADVHLASAAEDDGSGTTTLTIQGHIYFLPATEGTTTGSTSEATDDSATEGPSLPAAVSGKDPFAGIG